MKILLLLSLFFAFTNVHAQQQTMQIKLYFPNTRLDNAEIFFAIEGDPSLFYDWMQIGECPRELKNCDASNFIK